MQFNAIFFGSFAAGSAAGQKRTGDGRGGAGPAPTPRRRTFVRGTSALAFTLLILCGCGADRYEERLRETASLYGHLRAVNAQLGPAWSRADVGLALRPPLPFQTPLAAPGNAKDAASEDVDPRQPDFLTAPLPGLVDAWRSKITTLQGEEEEVFLFVLSNHSWFRSQAGGATHAGSFLAELESTLTGILGVRIEEGEARTPVDNIRFRLTAPAPSDEAARYLPPKDYTALRLVPQRPVGGRRLQAHLYERRSGEIQAAVVLFCPTEMPVGLQERMDLALATFEVDPVTPGQVGRAPETTPGRASAPDF